MGVPKFFRWISERYPMCSQLITENHIPEFDNLYLDMNGIIHNCSHPNDDDVHFRLTEQQIFIAIFNYIDHLFNKIKPKKMFFMAIDGVAPRAKMNQQRARRFKTAKEAAERQELAMKKGEQLPDAEAFDSNCITPGTVFMTKLSCHLKYYINKKVSEDANWRHVQVVLSGHEVPGEGEHKIMEYIRLAKAQPSHDPNTRHCLYGLDADLIMLGLVTHEPHFALLREEVSFGPSKKKASLFVGNDFLPHLPNIHIGEGALNLMFKVYRKVLPKLRGYMNENGHLHLERIETMFYEMQEIDTRAFEGDVVEAPWLEVARNESKGTLGTPGNIFRQGSKLVISCTQKELLQQIESFVGDKSDKSNLLKLPVQRELTFSSDIDPVDCQFLETIAGELGLSFSQTRNAQAESVYCIDNYEDEDSSDEEGKDARFRVLKKWKHAEVANATANGAHIVLAHKENALSADVVYEREFRKWKQNYYRSKLQVEYPNSPEFDMLVFKYMEGLQWVLFYYYKGVASWAWYYPYHYAPKISDLVNLSQHTLSFELGKAFQPFEQLMGVLPTASRVLIPPAFHELMTSDVSSIVDFYPQNFESDLNGKKNSWEAVIKIPFIDEQRLLDAMQSKERQLTNEERSRNKHGDALLFQYSDQATNTYPSSLPGIFPDIVRCYCAKSVYTLPSLQNCTLKLINGLLPGARKGIHSLAGFPTLDVLPHSATLGPHGVHVFQQPSRADTIVVSITHRFEGQKTETIARRLLGKIVYINYPNLMEGKVSYVADDHFKYVLSDNGSIDSNSVLPQAATQDIISTPHEPRDMDLWHKKADEIEHWYSKRYATIIGPVETLLGVEMLKGMKRLSNGALAKEFMHDKVTHASLQTVVESLECVDERYKERPPPPLRDEFPIGTRIFFLGQFSYGCPGLVTAVSENNISVRLFISGQDNGEEPKFGQMIASEFAQQDRYQPSYIVARKLGMSSLALSRLSSSLHVVLRQQDQKWNLGLCMKFEGKRQKILGYTRKSQTGWEYSTRAFNLLKSFTDTFPEFVRGLERSSNGDYYQATDFYPAETAFQRLTEVKDWLKQCETKDFERVPLETLSLTKDYVKRLEEELDKHLQQPSSFKSVMFKNVPPQIILKPEHGSSQMSNQMFRLGDRVVSVQDTGSAPFAVKGTVIAVEKDQVEVLFDHSFIGGNSLNDRCSNYRGLAVPRWGLLNLTYLQPPHNISPELPVNAKPMSVNQTPQHHHHQSNHQHSSYYRNNNDNTNNQWSQQQQRQSHTLPDSTQVKSSANGKTIYRDQSSQRMSESMTQHRPAQQQSDEHHFSNFRHNNGNGNSGRPPQQGQARPPPQTNAWDHRKSNAPRGDAVNSSPSNDHSQRLSPQNTSADTLMNAIATNMKAALHIGSPPAASPNIADSIKSILNIGTSPIKLTATPPQQQQQQQQSPHDMEKNIRLLLMTSKNSINSTLKPNQITNQGPSHVVAQPANANTNAGPSQVQSQQRSGNFPPPPPEPAHAQRRGLSAAELKRRDQLQFGSTSSGQEESTSRSPRQQRNLYPTNDRQGYEREKNTQRPHYRENGSESQGKSRGEQEQSIHPSHNERQRDGNGNKDRRRGQKKFGQDGDGRPERSSQTPF